MHAKPGTFSLAAIGLTVGLGAFWQTAPLRAADPPSERGGKFGMFGLVGGQTARLNLVYSDPPGELVAGGLPG